MRQFFKILFACVCAMILFGLIAFLTFIGIIAGASAGSDKTEIQSNSVLLLDLNDNIQEQSRENPFAAFSGGESSTTGLNDVLKSIAAAKNDEKIKGIYIKMGSCNIGWATLKEVKDALVDFKTSKKFIISYGEMADQKSYYVASVGTSVYLNPSGMFEFKGLAVTGTFYKNLIDKLDIKSEAFHCGKFKGAYEPYKLEKYSDPNRYQLSVLLQDIYSEFLQTVSSKTSLDTATLAKMANEGSIKFPSDAVKNKFIDATIYSDSVEHLMKSKLALTSKEKIHFVTTDEYVESVSSGNKSKNKIAVIYAEGEIHDGEGHDGIYSKNFTKDIRKIAEDETIKAVVLRVNSPGGSALASEIIYHELAELRKKKPIVVSMGNYAASGGYYISCAADSIFADNTTLTGSIGVVGVMFNIGDMLKNKVGVTFDEVKTGPYADFPNMTRPMTDAERAWIQNYLDTTYTLFKSRVANARHLTMEQVEDLAQGHVYSGKLGQELKLVDGMGNTARALKSAASLAKVGDYKIVEYPKPVDKMQEILSNLTGKKREDAMLKSFLGDDYKIYKEIQKAKSKENRIQTIIPYDFDIK